MKEIGDTITFYTSTGTHTAVITGRNWSFNTLLSYIVRWNGIDIPICPQTHRSQLAL